MNRPKYQRYNDKTDAYMYVNFNLMPNINICSVLKNDMLITTSYFSPFNTRVKINKEFH